MEECTRAFKEAQTQLIQSAKLTSVGTLASLHELEAARHTQRRASRSSMVPASEATPSQPPTAIPILLADDEALTRTFCGELLTERGFRVFTASSGAEALELACQRPVEAVLLDIRMH